MKDDIKIIEKAKKLHKLGKIDEAIKKIKFSESQKKDFFEAQLLLVIETIKKKRFQ